MAWAAADDDDEDERIVGTCNFFCPPDELREREKWNDFDPLEKAKPAELAVKKYKRNIEASDRAPERLRTPQCLLACVDYLVSLLDQDHLDLEHVHNFLWDRLRSVRTDLSIQRLLGCPESIAIHEKAVRFYIVSSYELCEHKCTVDNPHGFDAYLNREQMTKTLSTLLSIYQGLGDEARLTANEAEFRSYDLLMSHDACKLMNMRKSLLKSKEVQFALKVIACIKQRNYSRFFKLWKQATYLQGCLIHSHAAQMRLASLRLILNTSIFGSGRVYPLGALCKTIHLDREHIQECIKTVKAGALTEDGRSVLTNSKIELKMESRLESEGLMERTANRTDAQALSKVIHKGVLLNC